MITVEELQIILGCDATVAETALDKIIAKVDAFKARVGKSLEATAVKTQQTAERINMKLLPAAAPDAGQARQTKASTSQKSYNKISEQWEAAREAYNKYLSALNGGDAMQTYGAKVEYLESKLAALKDEFDNAFSAKCDSAVFDKFSRKIEDITKQLNRAKESYDAFTAADRRYEGSLRVHEEAQNKSASEPSRTASQADNQSSYAFNYVQHTRDMQRVQAEVEAMSQDSADDIADKWSAADEALSRYIRSADEVAGIDPAAKLRMSIELLNERLQTATLKWQDLFQDSRATPAQIDTARNSVKNLVDKIDAAKVKLEQLEGRRIEVNPELNTDGVKQRFNEIERLSNRAWRNIDRHSKKACSSMGKNVKKATGKIGGMFSKLGKKIKDIFTQMVIWRTINAVLTSLKDGLQNIARGNEGANKSFSQLATSTLYLKNSLAAALLPALQAIMPIITQIIDAFARAANMVGAFIAALTGKATFVQAIQLQQNYAGSLNGTAEAAEKVHQQLAGFDELNIIQSKSDGGGAYNPATDYGGMFEEVEIPDNVLSFLERLKEKLSPETLQYIQQIPKAFEEIKKSLAAIWESEAFQKILAAVASVSLDALTTTLWIIADVLKIIQGIFQGDWGILWDGTKSLLFDTLVSPFTPLMEGVASWFYGDDYNAWSTAFSDKYGYSNILRLIQAAIHGDEEAIAALEEYENKVSNLTSEEKAAAWEKTWDTIIGNFKSKFAPLANWLNEKVISPIGDFFAGLWNTVYDAVVEWWTKIKNFFSSIPNWFLSNIVYPIANFFIGIANAIITAVNWVIEQLNKIQIPMPEWVAKLLGVKKGTFGFNIPKLSLLDNLRLNAFSGGGHSGGSSYVAALASGGIAYGDTLVQVGEYANARSNPEVIAPLSKLTSLMGSGNDTRQFVPLFQSTIALLRQIADKETTLNIGGREFGRTVKRCLNEYEQAIGTT